MNIENERIIEQIKNDIDYRVRSNFISVTNNNLKAQAEIMRDVAEWCETMANNFDDCRNYEKEVFEPKIIHEPEFIYVNPKER